MTLNRSIDVKHSVLSSVNSQRRLPIELSCIKTADFHENAFDILKSNIIWDSSEWWAVRGIVIASSIGSLGQSVSKKLLNNYYLT